VLLYVFFVLFYVFLCSLYCLFCDVSCIVCVYVYWTSATGWLPNCSYISYHNRILQLGTCVIQQPL